MKLFSAFSLLFSTMITFAYLTCGSARAARSEVDDFAFACKKWLENNGSIQASLMKIEKLPGKPRTNATVLDQLEEGGIVFTAYFKGGVTAYERAKDEYYVLFHPEDKYHWPTVLKKAGSLLVIGTRGEGVAVIDLKRNYLKKIDLPEPFNEVRSLEVSDSVMVINGSYEIKRSVLHL